MESVKQSAGPTAYTRDPRVNTGVDLAELDQLAHVSLDIVTFIRSRAGRHVLDFGCGTGGYSYRLQELGFDVTAADIYPHYVELSRRLGVNAVQAEPDHLPFPDQAFDTVFLVEVLEHIPDANIPAVLGEARRVARGNVLLTVPDCTQHEELVRQEFLFGHFRAVDHVQFFTADTLDALLRRFFPEVQVRRGEPLFPHRLLPPVVRRPLSLLYRLGLLKPTIFSRLYAEARTRG